MISAQGLTKYYDDTCAIRDLSFEIAGGEIVGILGLNGAGKTTTLRVLACLLLPSRGTVRINGLDVVDAPHEIRKMVGFLPETPPLYDDMSVESYLLFAAQIRGLSASRAKERLQEVLETTNIGEVRHQIIGSLSHGFRQRVGIAQAIIHDPPVLILDEPIQGLDPVQIVEMRELVRGLKGRHTILLSSHILTEIHQTCDRILMLQAGELAAVGTESELSSMFRGARGVSVTARGDGDELVQLIGGLEHVDRCERVASASGDTDVVQLTVTCSQDVREALSRAIVERGFGLLELGRAHAELESVFLQLSRGGQPPTDSAESADAA